ncbi:hypothetical protein KZ288_26680, partial [Escherichia coli]|uniref:hypothetical protein n=1 Tax=Escherichia coli TaxID=562 RepID=UPI001EDB9F9F
TGAPSCLTRRFFGKDRVNDLLKIRGNPGKVEQDRSRAAEECAWSGQPGKVPLPLAADQFPPGRSCSKVTAYSSKPSK